MMGTRLIALLRLVLTILAMAGTVVLSPASAQLPQGGSASASADFDVMVADAKATMLIDPAKTIEKARAAERAAQSLIGAKRKTGIATAEWLQGEAYLRLNDYQSAEPLIEKALREVSGAGPPSKLTGDVLLSRGGVHTLNGNVALALDDYQRAHNIFRDIGETRSRAIALLNIAVLYQEAKDHNNALKYFSQAMEVYKGDPSLLLAIYNNRGDALKELGRFEESQTEFQAALKLAREMNSPVLEATILRNIARGQLLAGKLDAADQTIAQGFSLTRRANIASDNETFWSVAAQAALQRGNLSRARTLIGRTFAGVDPTRTALASREAHQTAFEVFKAVGDEPLALVHLEALKRLDDKATELATSTNTALMAARFDFANQELRIAKLKADELQRNIAFERQKAETQRLMFVGAGVVTIIIVLMLAYGIITLRRSRNEVRAANIDLAATNSALGKALAAKTEFLATTSHEIRTPLNGILGMTQVMLADRTLSAPMRDRIGVVHGAGVTMRALVDDILDVAKMETGNMTIERVPFDMKATLRDVTRMWEEQAKGRGIGFSLDLADAPDWIEGDAARLRQIVFNLLSNALKFTEAGSVTVKVAAAGSLLTIAVGDTGIGIPADKYEIIFESFRQVDAGTTRKFGGTGLGLAICRNLARAMEGDVRVTSAPGTGSCFTLELPLIAVDAPEIADATDSDGGGALLILDRSPITRSMLRAVLEARAGTVLFAASVEEAIERLQNGGVDQLLVDDATVKATGDAEAALAGLAQASGTVRTTLLWLAPDDAQRSALLATGIDAVIAKPIAGAALADALYPFDALPSAHLVSRAA